MPIYPLARNADDITHNLQQVRHCMAQACLRVGRATDSVRLLPVSKTVDLERLRAAHQAGCLELGENKVQEAHGKAQTLSELQDLRWILIGHLQTNKVRHAVQFASEFQALDSLRLAEELDRRLQQVGRGLPVMVQVNTSGEDSKYGLPPDQVASFLQALRPFHSLQVTGLMTLAMLSSETQAVRQCFRRLRLLRDQLREQAPAGMSLEHLSMGMSGDYELAIEEGATVVRVGQAIFGARTIPDSHYWPEHDKENLHV
ncbi:YggS family pyridoxal phosphate-dependent enzyme [Paludibacterium sp. B53371]|uniref:YggS family pyridoxal phosphate-dependent enzyme n=1 Tax=Paludibacterium sp. B53371 TaxID=2806263 RepID=UPI001C04AD38|nr:YggS family pyridoxal phosphate-dependent enzyme [Paludibacterium sp. B53371]